MILYLNKLGMRGILSFHFCFLRIIRYFSFLRALYVLIFFMEVHNFDRLGGAFLCRWKFLFEGVGLHIS
jgi:hypothetical protein